MITLTFMQFATLIFISIISILFSIICCYKAEKKDKTIKGLLVVMEIMAFTSEINKKTGNKETENEKKS